MGQLAVHLVGDGAFLQHHHHATGAVGQRRDLDVDEPLARRRGEPRSTRYSLTGASRSRTCSMSASSGEPKGSRSRSASRRIIGALMSKKASAAMLASSDLAVGVDRQHGMRQGVEHRLVPGSSGNGIAHAAHAAALQSKAVDKSRETADDARRVSDVRTCGAARRFAAAARLRDRHGGEARCLRAWRMPCRAP